MLRGASVATAPVMSYAEQYANPHFKARHVYERLDHPFLQGEVVYGIPWKLSRTPGALRRRAPFVGEHNDYVFKELLGLTAVEFSNMVQQGAIR